MTHETLTIEVLAITKRDLRAALLKWEAQARDGVSTRTRAEVEALPVEQVADESADHLWELLTAV